MQPDDPLAGLRALHLPPEASSFWGDVGLALALGLVIALAASFLVRFLFKPRLSLRASAARALAEAATLKPEDRRAAQAALLRRIVKTVEGEDAARAQGTDWTATLDRVFGTDFFSAHGGRVFAQGLYARPQGAVDDPGLDRELAGLMAKLKR